MADALIVISLSCFKSVKRRLFSSSVIAREQVEVALQKLPGLANVTVSRGDPKGVAYYPADHAATRWYASSRLHKSLNVQTFDWLVTFTGLVGQQPLLQVGDTRVRKRSKTSAFIFNHSAYVLQSQLKTK